MSSGGCVCQLVGVRLPVESSSHTEKSTLLHFMLHLFQQDRCSLASDRALVNRWSRLPSRFFRSCFLYAYCNNISGWSQIFFSIVRLCQTNSLQLYFPAPSFAVHSRLQAHSASVKHSSCMPACVSLTCMYEHDMHGLSVWQA